MGKKKLKVAGSWLKVLARSVESPVVGKVLQKQVKTQMGINALQKARIAEDEAPALRPAAALEVLCAPSTNPKGNKQ